MIKMQTQKNSFALISTILLKPSFIKKLISVVMTDEEIDEEI